MDKKSLIAQISKNLTVSDSEISLEPKKSRNSSPQKENSSSRTGDRTDPPKSPAVSKVKKDAGAGSGKQTALWLDDEDRSILHEMGMLLYSQGIKPSHNVVIRAAIRLMPKDHRFFEKVQELASQDGRKIRHHK